MLLILDNLREDVHFFGSALLNRTRSASFFCALPSAIAVRANCTPSSIESAISASQMAAPALGSAARASGDSASEIAVFNFERLSGIPSGQVISESSGVRIP